ncbi:hypothetical protein D6789_03515 [Candidatus Woesearchaeota archaeon]|nr:MAG: hypothetical protein D6789_03515 [Candidatus Woesearchaeota archaeon]
MDERPEPMQELYQTLSREARALLDMSVDTTLLCPELEDEYAQLTQFALNYLTSSPSELADTMIDGLAVEEAINNLRTMRARIERFYEKHNK